MKGDFSRRTFRKNKHYRKVNMQQGRVQLDADWNEQNDIHFHYEKAFLQDVIGKSGTQVTDPGFAIIENVFLFAWENIPTNAADNDNLKNFLKNNFALDWIITDEQQFVKSSDGNTISISKNPYSLSITLDSANAKALLQTMDEKGPTGQSYDFVVKDEGGEGGQKNIYTRWYQIGKGNYYVNGILCENESVVDASRQPDLSFGASRDIFLFNWNSVPGALDESNRLKNFLRYKFHLDWIITDEQQQQQFVKSPDGNTISISSADSSKSASITLSSDNAAATLTINNNNTANVYTFIVKIENTQKKIYDRMKNPYFPDQPGLYLAYLDVWERHVTSLDDSYILEQALGGVDTTTRTKILWQVKLANVSADLSDGEEKCVSNIESWSVLTSSPTGKLHARSKPPEPAVNACSLIESAGYQRLENQLYRVEVHNGGTLADGATFKWSRDNGTVVTNVAGFNTSESKILIEERSNDKLRDFEIGKWIEVTDKLHEWLGIPGTLVRINDIKENILIYDATKTIGDAITEENFPAMFGPKVRRWDSRKDDDDDAVLISSNTKKDTDGYIDLEDGVQIRLDDVGNYRTDNYWLIPARTRIGDIEWPRAGNRSIDEPLALLPEGIEHDYAPLAILEYTNDGSFKVVADCRNFFSSLSDFMSLQYVGGDGQQALPGNLLQAPLQVGVMVGKVPINNTPLKKARVKFTIVQSNTPQPGVPGKLKSIDGPSLPLEGGAEIVIETNEGEGIARCTWELGDSPSQQQVKAVLLDECGNETDDLVPIYFNATLPISFYYIRGDGQEAVPGRTIDLAAGVRIGNAPVTSGYKVKFEVQPPGNGTLSDSEVPLDADGIAKCKWILENDDNTPRQQVRAVLLFENSNRTNLPPIYFNAGFAAAPTTNTSIATTGLIFLSFPEGVEGDYISEEFNHFLTGLDHPPAVMLGLTEDFGETVKFMEDGVSRKRNKERWLFKAVSITTEKFKVIVHKANPSQQGVLDSISLQWWAVPAKFTEGKQSRMVLDNP
jgi:hypothetical protein